MNSKDIAYTARVNAACWLIRKARKIAMELPNMTHDQRQEIELEIVDIGMRLYNETRQQPQPEVTHDPHARAKSRYEFGDESERDAYVAGVVDQIAEATHDPGENHELDAYIAAVRELAPNAAPGVIAHFRSKGFTAKQVASILPR